MMLRSFYVTCCFIRTFLGFFFFLAVHSCVGAFHKISFLLKFLILFCIHFMYFFESFVLMIFFSSRSSGYEPKNGRSTTDYGPRNGSNGPRWLCARNERTSTKFNGPRRTRPWGSGGAWSRNASHEYGWTQTALSMDSKHFHSKLYYFKCLFMLEFIILEYY